MLKAYKYRIYPNKTQEVLLQKSFGCVRYFWNYMTEVFNSYDEETNPKPEYKTSTEFRKEQEFLLEVSAAILQQKEKDFQQFKKQYFSKNRKLKIARPKFKSKNDNQSFRLPNQKFKIVDKKIQLEKIGKVRIVLDRELPTDCKFMSVTISKNKVGQYHASVLVEQEIQHLPKTTKEVGIDVGVKTFLIQSDGIEVNNLRLFSKNQTKLKRLQQHFSRKQKGSRRREKCRKKIAKLYQKINNQKEHFLHNESLRIVKNYDYIYIEDLDVKSMLESKLMSKEISDVSWSKFFNYLAYKAEWYGKILHKVDRYYASSKTCNDCGNINTELKLSDREWVCKSCGVLHDRDLNAAKNILKQGRCSYNDLTNTEREVTNSVKCLELLTSDSICHNNS